MKRKGISEPLEAGAGRERARFLIGEFRKQAGFHRDTNVASRAGVYLSRGWLASKYCNSMSLADDVGQRQREREPVGSNRPGGNHQAIAAATTNRHQQTLRYDYSSRLSRVESAALRRIGFCVCPLAYERCSRCVTCPRP